MEAMTATARWGKPRVDDRLARPLGALLCAVVLVAAAERAGAVSYQGERDLGQRFDLAARQRVPMLEDPEVVGYVGEVGRKIVASLDDPYFDYQFAVVRDPRVNAFAVPGGFVYVNSGLLSRVKNEDELAAVLGHEIAHVHAHHVVRQQEATQAINYAALLGTLLSIVQPAAGALASAASASVTLQYQREFEQEADYLGARYLQSTGYDPRAMLDFFKQLSDDNRLGPSGAPPYLQSHPVTDERLNHLEAVLKTQQWAPHPRQPPSFALQRAQALARVRSEPPNDVLKAYRTAAENEPSNPTAQYLFGVVSLETGQLDSAGPALAAARAGGVEAADRELGRLALRQRDPAKARELLERYLASTPNDAGAHVELAKVLEAVGDSAAAMQEYQRALALSPQLEAAHHGLGLLAGRAGQQGDGLYHLATAARLDGDYTTALSQYSRAAPLLGVGDARRDETRQWVALLSDYLHVPAPHTP
jgi:beta-barrel assembly-enhancing protease